MCLRLDCRETAERRTDSTGTSGWKEPNAMERLNRGAEIGAL